MINAFAEKLLAEINVDDELLKQITDDLLSVYQELGDQFTFQYVVTKVQGYDLSLDQSLRYIALMYAYGLFAERIDWWEDKPAELLALLNIVGIVNSEGKA